MSADVRITRQLRYSQDQKALALDLCLFINGLPVATFELNADLDGYQVYGSSDVDRLVELYLTGA